MSNMNLVDDAPSPNDDIPMLSPEVTHTDLRTFKDAERAKYACGEFIFGRKAERAGMPAGK